MTSTFDFNADENDLFRELINIAFGNSAASIANLLDTFVSLDIPHVNIISPTDLGDHYHKKVNDAGSVYVFKQGFNGALSGENLFFIDENSANNLSRHLNGFDQVPEGHSVNSDILEMTNLVATACVRNLSKQFDVNTNFDPPQIAQHAHDDQAPPLHFADMGSLIAVDISLKLEKEAIEGEMVLVIHNASLTWLREQLANILPG